MGGFGVLARSLVGATFTLALLAACGAESYKERARDDGVSGGLAGAGNQGGGGSGAGQGGSGGAEQGGAEQGGSGGMAALGGVGTLGGAGAGAGEGGLSMGGAGAGGVAAASGAGAGSGGTGPSCNPWPTANNAPACPSPGVVSGDYVESPCVPELSCEFLVPTGDPCLQPPRLQRFECCEWGFATQSCPSLPAGQDPRCVLPIAQGRTCDVEGLACQVVVYEGGQPNGFICCDGIFRIATSC